MDTVPLLDRIFRYDSLTMHARRTFATTVAVAVFDLKFNRLTFLEFVELRPFHGRMIEEDVAALASDESKAAIGDNFLNDTMRS